MTLLERLRGLTSLPQIRDELLAQRERILSNILIGMSLLGFVLLSVYSVLAVQEERWTTLAAFGVIYLWTFSVTVFRRLPYIIRAASMLLIIYLLASITLIQDGLPGNGRIYLVAFAIFAGILTGVKGGSIAILISIATLIGLNLGIQQGILQAPTTDTTSLHQNITFWAVAITAFLTVAVATSISMLTLLRGLEGSLGRAKRLSIDLEKERNQLENNVLNRTVDLERRLVQIRTAAEISRTIAAVLDPNELLQTVADLLRERFDLYYVGVFILGDKDKYAILRAGTGEPGKKMLSEGHRLAVGGASMVGWTTSNQKPRIALDVGRDAVRFNNPHLPLTRSELALPILSGSRVLGALTIQSTKPEAFDEDDITVLKGTADSLGVALENARHFRQAQQSLEEIKTLHQQYLRKAWEERTRQETDLGYTHEIEHPFETRGSDRIDLPVSLRDQVIGRLVLEGVRGTLTGEERNFIEAIANEAAIALENTRLLEEIQRRAQIEQKIGLISAKTQSSLDMETVLRTAVQEIGMAVNAARVQIRLGDIHQTEEPGRDGGIVVP
jgi:GAF domain-containing protein